MGIFRVEIYKYLKIQKKRRIKPQENLNHCTFTFAQPSSRRDIVNEPYAYEM